VLVEPGQMIVLADETWLVDVGFVEEVVAVLVGSRGTNKVAVSVVQVDSRAGHRRLTGILDTVVVTGEPHPVTDLNGCLVAPPLPKCALAAVKLMPPELWEPSRLIEPTPTCHRPSGSNTSEAMVPSPRESAIPE